MEVDIVIFTRKKYRLRWIWGRGNATIWHLFSLFFDKRFNKMFEKEKNKKICDFGTYLQSPYLFHLPNTPKANHQ